MTVSLALDSYRVTCASESMLRGNVLSAVYAEMSDQCCSLMARCGKNAWTLLLMPIKHQGVHQGDVVHHDHLWLLARESHLHRAGTAPYADVSAKAQLCD